MLQGTVSDAMDERFQSVCESSPLDQALRAMEELRAVALPVRTGERSWRGLLVKEHAVQNLGDRQARAGDVALPELVLTPDQGLLEARQLMREARVGRLPVVQDGTIVGSLSQADIRAYMDLEDMLGFSLSHVDAEVAPGDCMFRGSVTEYLMGGAGALQCIRRALAATGNASVSRILDFACGHGRVLRMLRVAFPDARLTACDLDADGVEFCARRFGATPVVSSESLAEVELDGPFDLIWSGSLLTHLDEGRWDEALSLFRAALSESGTLVFSTHGEGSAQRLRRGEVDHGLSAAQVGALIEGYDGSGFAYADYPGQAGYGISVCGARWLREKVRSCGLTLVAHEETAWGGLHDLVVCTRSDDAAAG